MHGETMKIIVMDLLLCNMAVLHIRNCTVADINCYGLVIMKFGGFTHQ
jgi:hypothetical protein